MNLVQLPGEAKGKDYIIASGTTGCMVVIGEKEWKAYIDYMHRLPRDNRNVRTAIRYVIGNSQCVTPDENGCICIPDHMMMLHFDGKDKLRAYPVQEYVEGREEKVIFGKKFASYIIAAED